MNEPAVHDIHDIHEVRSLLEGAATLHSDLPAAGDRNDHRVIEAFIGLIRSFHPSTRPRLIAA